MAAGTVYAIAALPFKVEGHPAGGRTLDGIVHWSEDERSAVRWIRANVPWNAVLVEGSGSSYHPETNRISAATGRSTLLGWPGHEVQWRGESYPDLAGERERVLEMIYSSAEGEALQHLLHHWRIDYVFLGPTERRKYHISADREGQLSKWMPTVFEQGTLKILRRREAGDAP